MVNDPVIKDDVLIHRFKHYDEENGISLGGRSNIITIELSKLEQIAQKSVAEMDSIERWAVFFRYTTDKEKRELVNEIIKQEEGIAMAGQVLLSISKDEKERARLTSEYKFAVDLQSKMVDSKRAALRQVARNMIADGESNEKIMRYTGLTFEEVEELRCEQKVS